MFERFTDRARRVVVFAQEEARLLNHNHIGTEHVLLGLLREDEGVAAKTLEALGISLDTVRRQVEEIVGRGEGPATGHIPFTPRGKKVLELSLREAMDMGHEHISPEHVLLGLLREEEGVAAQVLVSLRADLNRARQTVVQLLSGYSGRVLEPSREPTRGELAETALASKVDPADFPLCPFCSSPLRHSLRVGEVPPGTGEQPPVRIAYCGDCGSAVAADF